MRVTQMLMDHTKGIQSVVLPLDAKQVLISQMMDNQNAYRVQLDNTVMVPFQLHSKTVHEVATAQVKMLTQQKIISITLLHTSAIEILEQDMQTNTHALPVLTVSTLNLKL